MKRTGLVTGLLFAALFGACLWNAASFQYGTEFAPGPGFAPVWLSAIGIGLSLLIAFDRRVDAPGSQDSTEKARSAFDKRGILRVATTLCGLVVMLLVADRLGLISAILLFLLFLTLFVQRLSPAIGIGASVGTVVFVYVVFVRLLDVPIPPGPLGF
jgi:putative tricarboxylic transport membrane protein